MAYPATARGIAGDLFYIDLQTPNDMDSRTMQPYVEAACLVITTATRSDTLALLSNLPMLDVFATPAQQLCVGAACVFLTRLLRSAIQVRAPWQLNDSNQLALILAVLHRMASTTPDDRLKTAITTYLTSNVDRLTSSS